MRRTASPLTRPVATRSTTLSRWNWAAINSVANLWPEASASSHKKDGIEDVLHHDVCDGGLSLRTAQEQIARDWRHTAVGAPAAAPSPQPPAPAPAPNPDRAVDAGM